MSAHRGNRWGWRASKWVTTGGGVEEAVNVTSSSGRDDVSDDDDGTGVAGSEDDASGTAGMYRLRHPRGGLMVLGTPDTAPDIFF